MHSEVARDTDQSQLIIKKSWDVALGPVKGVTEISSCDVAGSFTCHFILDSNESPHHVHGWQLDLNLSHYDGRDEFDKTIESNFHHWSHIQKL
jgi:hypothetical protein